MRKYPIPEFKINDIIAYSVQFLKSINMSHSDLSHARGTVIGVIRFGERSLIEIKWDNKSIEGDINTIPNKVLDANLALVGLNPRFSNID